MFHDCIPLDSQGVCSWFIFIKWLQKRSFSHTAETDAFEFCSYFVRQSFRISDWGIRSSMLGRKVLFWLIWWNASKLLINASEPDLMHELNVLQNFMRILQWFSERRRGTRMCGWSRFSTKCVVDTRSKYCPAVLLDCTVSTHSSEKMVFHFYAKDGGWYWHSNFPASGGEYLFPTILYVFCWTFTLDGLLCTRDQLRF